MRRVCFLDNDIILKLAACDLFYDAVSSLFLEEPDLRILPSAEFFFQKDRSVQRKYPDDIRNCAITIAKKYSKIQRELVDIKALGDLQQIEGIDPGEALLTLASIHEESFYLTTGDKRYITALGSATQVDYIITKLSGRVICFEQVIRKIIYTQGFENTLTKVLPGRKYDIALMSIFGSGDKCTQDNVMLSLEGYIQDLRKNSGDLLADF